MKRTPVKLGAFVAVAVLLGVMELNTLTGPHVGHTRTYHAIFSGGDGVSGLRVGDEVRVSGVAVGRVKGERLQDASHVDVSFTANGNQVLTTGTWAVVRYANLLGQRYLALTRSGDPGPALAPGGTLTHTAPALSLTALFNGFRPLFATLTPQQVNDLSGEIVAVLQGQGARLDDLIRRTADLTANLAARDDTFNQVIDSLTSLLTTVSRHDDQLASVLTSLREFTGQLHAQGPGILQSLDDVDALTGSVAGLLGKLEDHSLPADIRDLNAVSGVVARHSRTLNTLVDSFVSAFGDFARITQNGNWGNIYACAVYAQTYGTPNVTTADALKALADALPALGAGPQVLAALAVPVPIQVPTGRAGHGTAQTGVCS